MTVIFHISLKLEQDFHLWKTEIKGVEHGMSTKIQGKGKEGKRGEIQKGCLDKQRILYDAE